MSCSLWRIHESIHRNDENQVFVLTNQPSTKDVAHKLNITVRSSKELAASIKEATITADMNISGDLEREFGARPVKERRPIRFTATLGASRSNETSVNGNITQFQAFSKSEEEAQKPEDQSESKLEKIVHHESPQKQEKEIYQNGIETAQKPQNGNILRQQLASSTTGGVQQISNAGQAESKAPVVAGAKNPSEANPRDPQENVLASGTPQQYSDKQELSDGRADSAVSSAVDLPSKSQNDVSAPSANIWFRSFAEAVTGNQARKPSPLPEHQTPDPIGTPARNPNRKNDTSKSKPELVEPASVEKEKHASLSESPAQEVEASVKPADLSMSKLDMTPQAPSTSFNANDSPDKHQESYLDNAFNSIVSCCTPENGW